MSQPGPGWPAGPAPSAGSALVLDAAAGGLATGDDHLDARLAGQSAVPADLPQVGCLRWSVGRASTKPTPRHEFSPRCQEKPIPVTRASRRDSINFVTEIRNAQPGDVRRSAPRTRRSTPHPRQRAHAHPQNRTSHRRFSVEPQRTDAARSSATTPTGQHEDHHSKRTRHDHFDTFRTLNNA